MGSGKGSTSSGGAPGFDEWWNSRKTTAPQTEARSGEGSSKVEAPDNSEEIGWVRAINSVLDPVGTMKNAYRATIDKGLDIAPSEPKSELESFMDDVRAYQGGTTSGTNLGPGSSLMDENEDDGDFSWGY